MRAARRLALLAFPSATLAVAAFNMETVRIHMDNMKTSFKAKNIFCLVDDSESSFNRRFPRTKWDNNWDSRDPSNLINPRKYDKADEATRQQMVIDATPTATRNVILIRHGQCHKDGENRLTELGREQAVLIGPRLAAMGPSWDKIVMSTLNRATDTAHLAAAALDPEIKKVSDAMLEEGAPYPPEPSHPLWQPRPNEFLTDGARIEAAFRKYIHRADPKQKEDSYELIVCHGNVIRYFVCRALQLPPEAFLRLYLANASITWLVIQSNGRVSLKSFGDVAHIPQEQITH